MSKQIEEHISEFMDGELLKTNQDRIIQKLCQDKDVKECWLRYHLISDAMKHNLPTVMDDRFAQSVMNALENEPTILAPKSISHKLIVKRKIAGAAIAASVAAVAVIGVQTMNRTNELVPSLAEMPSSDQYVRMTQSPSPAQASLPSQSLASQSLTSQSLTSQSLTSQSKYSSEATMGAVPALKASTQQNTASTQQKPKVISIYKYHPRLHKYLLNHNQHASGLHVQGVMPYARIVVTPVQQNKQEQ